MSRNLATVTWYGDCCSSINVIARPDCLLRYRGHSAYEIVTLATPLVSVAHGGSVAKEIVRHRPRSQALRGINYGPIIGQLVVAAGSGAELMVIAAAVQIRRLQRRR